MGMCADTSSACPQCRAWYKAKRKAAAGESDTESQYQAVIGMGKNLGMNRAERRRAGITRSRARKRGLL